jgi:hypothetical protein
MKLFKAFCLASLLGAATAAMAQSGAIAGRVQTADKGEPLPDANIVLVGSNLGATTDANGFYLIANVPPGIYQLRATFVGYTKTTVEEVRVRLNLTTTINFKLKQETLQGEAVTVVAGRQTLNPEVSASLADVDAEDLKSLPIANIEDAIRLQPGVEADLTIRGGNLNTVSFVVDGLNLREGRTHAPITGLSFTALEQMQVQTGGFNAEYGNVRSGLVQLVTKNPPVDRYIADFLVRYRPSQRLSFANGEAPTPAGSLTRGNQIIDDSGYDLDMTIGGPLIPASHQSLGNLRFLASFRQKSEPYLDAYDRQARRDRTAQLKLISDLKPNLKLTLMGLYGKVEGVADSVSSMMPSGVPSYPWGFENDFFKSAGLFKTDNLGLSDIEHKLAAATLLHTLSANTIVEIKAHRLESGYFLRPGPQQRLIDRDTSSVVLWSGKLDLTSQLNNHMQIKAGVEYLVSDYDIASELNDACSTRVYALGNAAALLCFDRVDYESPHRIYESWRAAPHQGAAYLQSKIKVNEMLINAGVRVDYFHSRGSRLLFDDFDQFLSQTDPQIRANALATAQAKRQLALSPRFGVAFPITPSTKLYFNYGHFRQMPQAQHLYSLQEKIFFADRSGITGIGDADIPMPRTVAYEFGYEQSLFGNYLISAAAYLRDIDKQTSFRIYLSDDVYYTKALPFNYNDVSGLELTFSKIKGDWLRGFVNFTYMSFKSGNFGPTAVFQNPLNQREYDRLTSDHDQNRAASQPYTHFSLEWLASPQLGPQWFGAKPLANWRVTLLGEWRAGKVFTWSGPIIDNDINAFGIQYSPHPLLRNNLRTRDFYRLDLRLSKMIETRFGSMQFFVDVNNLLNLKFLYFERPFAMLTGNPFVDYNAYMASLHLPEDAFKNLDDDEVPYLFISGNDRPGDVRKAGVAFVPIEIVRSQQRLPARPRNEKALYYVHNTATYFQFKNGSWQSAEAAFVQQVLKDKAYIDMPDKNNQTFLNPRSVSLGVRLSF